MKPAAFALVLLLPLTAHAQEREIASGAGPQRQGPPTIVEGFPQLAIEKFADGLKSPTSMAWADKHTLLIIEHWTGNVRAVTKGTLQKEPLFKLGVNFKGERGLLGIAVHPNFATNRHVYLFYTQSARDTPDGRSDIHRGQHLARFTLKENGDSLLLADQKIIYTFPYDPANKNGPNSCGGKILFGPDNKLYGLYGDQNRTGVELNDGQKPAHAGIIFRLNDDGTTPIDNPWATHTDTRTRTYFAIGIRNGFGLAFDPVSKNLFNTENGEETFDEINRVLPKFNSGWNYIMGPLTHPANAHRERRSVPADKTLGSLYADPMFSFYRCRGLTALTFLNTDAYGPAMKNRMMVGEVNGGWLMHFQLNEHRNAVVVNTPALENRVLLGDTPAEWTAAAKEILLADNFAGVTDVQLGPDGLLYILTYRDGTIWRLVPKPSGGR